MSEIDEMLSPPATNQGPNGPGWGPDYDDDGKEYGTDSYSLEVMEQPQSPVDKEDYDTELYAGSLEDYPNPEGTIEEELDTVSEKYEIPDYFDDVWIGDLGEDAVAAGAHVPSTYSFEEIDGAYDSLEYDEMVVGEDGELYGMDVYSWETHFIADENDYLTKSPEERELVNFHELSHASQYNGNWGSDLQGPLDLDPETERYLNQFGKDTPTPILEGYTQMMSEAAVENGRELGKGYYEAEKRLAEMDLWNKGLVDQPGNLRGQDPGRTQEYTYIQPVFRIVFELSDNLFDLDDDLGTDSYLPGFR